MALSFESPKRLGGLKLARSLDGTFVTMTAILALIDYAKNAALLTVGLSIYAQVRPRFARHPAVLVQILEGVCFSILMAVAIASPLQLQGGVRVDLRATVVCLSVIFGGPICGLLAAATGVVLRLAVGGPNMVGGVMIVAIPYIVSLAQRKWIRSQQRKVGYRDLFAIGLGIALYRIVLWVFLFGVDFTIEAMDAAWFGSLVLLSFSAVILGSAVLLVEERRSLAQIVADSEARFRSVLDQLPEGLTLVDRDDRFTYVNKAWEAVTGFSSAFALGKTRREIWRTRGIVGPFDQPELVEHIRDKAHTIRTEPRLLELKGPPRWIVGTLFPVRDAKGEIREIGTTGNEVTDLVVAREDLMRRENVALRYKKALIDAVRASQTDRPLLDSIYALTELSSETLGVERAVVLRGDFASGGVERLDLWERSKGRHAPSERAERDTGHAIWNLSVGLQREGVVAIPNVEAEPRLAARAEFMRQNGIRSLLIAHIFLDDRFAGFIGFSTVDETREWTSEDIHFARSIADLISLRMVTDRYRESLAGLDLIEDGIYIEGDDGRVLYANRVACRMAGIADVQHSPSFSAPSVIFPRPAVPLTQNRDHHEVTPELSTGRRDLRISRSRLPRGGTIVLLHDITRRRAAQRERERLEQQLMQAHKLEALGEMAGGIAHDFNNLLGAIGGFARFLEEDLSQDAERQHHARRILSACERGRALVAQILAFAKLRNVERHRVELHDLLNESIDLLKGLASPTTSISFDIENAAMPIYANDAQMTQLLVNLYANANEALDGEPGTVTVCARRIGRGDGAIEREERLPSRFGKRFQRRRMFGQLNRERDYVRIEVGDDGKGIASRILPRIFEPFYTTKHRQGGTGLGLAVVQSVVSLHDGVVYVDSREDKGTNFSIYLPLAEATHTGHAKRAAVEPTSAGSERILVVDDDIDVADMLSIGLERLGYAVATVNDPVEALAAFKSDPDSWDVAVLDRVMPNMDGITLAARLRALRASLPVILCTGLDDGTIEQSEGRSAFDAFFTKPVAPGQIASAIRSLVDR